MDKDLLILLEKIRQDNDHAFAELSEMYSSVMENAVRRFVPSFDISHNGEGQICDEDDLRQFATIALYRAAKTYDHEGRGQKVSFGLYAKICINNALVSALRKYKSEKKKRDLAASSCEVPQTQNDPLQVILSSEVTEQLKMQIYSLLSDYEKRVLNYYIVGKSVCEIAERLGKKEKSVSNALYRMRVKVRGLLKNQ